jgi:hypothetical protein
MKEASKLVSRCVYINILKATESQKALEVIPLLTYTREITYLKAPACLEQQKIS